MKAHQALVVKWKWYIQEHSQSGPSRVLASHEKGTTFLGETLLPTTLPKAKPLAQWGLQGTEVPLNAWAGSQMAQLS